MSESTSSASDHADNRPAGDTPRFADRAEKRVSTTHTLEVDGQVLTYEATVATLNPKDAKDRDEASVFCIAYTLQGDVDPASRPVTFCFNGGPGSSSVWLHFGVLGPRRIEVPDLVTAPPPPHHLVDNLHTLLTDSDLVFIDPVGTGFSRPQGEREGKDFHGMEEDSRSVARFIELWLSRNGRWSSPRFLAGESYGTTRAAQLAAMLQDRGIALNGLVLVSLALDFQSFVFEPGNLLPYITYLPTYAATAWYHGRLTGVPADLHELLTEVRAFALDVYAPALLRGASLSDQALQEVAQQLAHYTGIAAEVFIARNLRVDYLYFAKNVLGPGYETVGRMDARFVGPDLHVDERMTSDPSINAPFGVFTSAANDYLRRTLAWEGDDPYEILSLTVNESWKWQRDKRFGFPDAGRDLKRALVMNPHLEVLFMNGIYDLATPFFAAEYTAWNLELPRALQERISLTYYEAGHMMYFHPPSLDKLRDDLRGWYRRIASRRDAR